MRLHLVTFLAGSIALTACASAPPEEGPPKQASIRVPFTSQAPYKDWDDPYQEACEEASVIMVDYFLGGKKLGQIAGDLPLIVGCQCGLQKYNRRQGWQ